MVKKLERIGLELRKVTMADEAHIAFFKDPDGHTVEIMEKGLSFQSQTYFSNPTPV